MLIWWRAVVWVARHISGQFVKSLKKFFGKNKIIVGVADAHNLHASRSFRVKPLAAFGGEIFLKASFFYVLICAIADVFDGCEL